MIKKHLAILATIAFLAWAAIPANAAVIMVDFGADLEETTGTDSQSRAWNNVSGAVGQIAASGQFVSDAVDTSGAVTTVDLSLNLTGTPHFSSPTSRVGFSDTSVDAAPYSYPLTVYRDAINVWPGNYVDLKVTGLAIGETYDFSLFGLRGSSVGGSGPRVTSYAIGAETYTIDSWNNQDTFAVFSGISPNAQGEVTITVNGTPEDNTNGYLNALEIEGNTETVLVDFGVDVEETATDGMNRTWNNVSGIEGPLAGSGQFVTDALGSNGTATTIDLSLELTGTPHFSDPVASSGDTVVDAAPYDYPDTAYTDSINVWPENFVTLDVEGLTVRETYEFRVFGLRGASVGGAATRATTFTIGGETYEIDSWNNQSDFAVFSGISPDAQGKVSITVNGTPEANTNGYLTVMEIEGLFAEGASGPPAPGDANGDGVVDDDDASTLASNWLKTGMDWADGDFNDDGVVDDADATLLATNWQTSTSASVPEPTFLIMLLGALALLPMRRRH